MTTILPWRDRATRRHRADRLIANLRAENVSLHQQLADRTAQVDDRDRKLDAADRLIESLTAELGVQTKAVEVAGRRIAELTEAANQAAELNARAVHVPAIGHRPVEAGEEPTQPMDCTALRAAVGTGDNPRAVYRVLPLHQAPIAGLGAVRDPARVDSDTTQSIPIPTAA